MRHSLSVRIENDVAEWLEDATRNSGLSQQQIVRDQFMQTSENDSIRKPFMKFAGVKSLEPGLSTRKDVSRT